MTDQNAEALRLETLASKMHYALPDQLPELSKEAIALLNSAARTLRQPHSKVPAMMEAVTLLLLSVERAKVGTHRRWWIRNNRDFDLAVDKFLELYGPVKEITL